MTFGKLRAIEAAAGGGSSKAAESAEASAEDQEATAKAEAPEVSLLQEGSSDQPNLRCTHCCLVF